MTIELKKWAFDKVTGWGTLAPATEGKPAEFKPWTLTECMNKADELAAWLSSPLPAKGD